VIYRSRYEKDDVVSEVWGQTWNEAVRLMAAWNRACGGRSAPTRACRTVTRYPCIRLL